MCVSTEDVKRNDQIERKLRVDGRELHKSIRVLVLGAEHSAKEQFLKTLKLSDHPISKEEMYDAIPMIHNTILAITQRLIKQANAFNYNLLPENVEIARVISSADPEEAGIIFALKHGIQNLWSDPAVQTTFGRISYELPESTSYFMGNLDRIIMVDYFPTDSDMCQSMSKKTTKVVEWIAYIDAERFEFIDISNMVSLKRKWLHFFQDVTLVAFFTPLSDYCRLNEEGVNRMQESIRMLRELVEYRVLSEVAFVLLFSKSDLFEQEIKQTPLAYCFPEYRGKQDYEESSQFVLQKFKEIFGRETEVYHSFFNQLPASIAQLPTVISDVVRNVVIAKAMKAIEKTEKKPPAKKV